MAGPFEFVLSRCVRRGVLAACAPRRSRAYLEVYVRINGLMCIFSGSRATNTPGQAPLCPKRRPPQPQHLIFNVFSPRWSAIWVPYHHEP